MQVFPDPASNSVYVWFCYTLTCNTTFLFDLFVSLFGRPGGFCPSLAVSILDSTDDFFFFSSKMIPDDGAAGLQREKRKKEKKK